MFLSLLGSRRFLPLFIVQFLSALNDNFVKTALATLVGRGRFSSPVTSRR